MKKLLLILTMAALLIASTACASTPETPPAPQPESTGSESAVSGQEQAADDDAEQTFLYGKVSTIVGNEIDMALGTTEDELPNLLDTPIEEEDGKTEMPAMTMVPATPAGNSADFVAGDKVETNDPIIDITYTDDTKSVLLPAGVTMIDLAGKGRSQLEDIKEGCVLRVTMKGETVVSVEFLS